MQIFLRLLVRYCFYLTLVPHRKITVMGIHRHPRPYRRSRAGTKLFHKIKSITSQHRDETTTTPEHNSVNKSVLIRCEGMSNMTNQPYTMKCGLVNCQSVVNKTQLIQTEVLTNKLYICAVTEGLNKMTS